MLVDFTAAPAPASTGTTAGWSRGLDRPRTGPPPVCPPRRTRPPASPLTSADRLREALLVLGDHRGQIVAHREKSWASITFSGARHTLTLLFAGEDAVAAGERFIAALPEHEFAIPGQLVADASITEAEHRLLPAPRLVVTCELLLLEEG